MESSETIVQLDRVKRGRILFISYQFPPVGGAGVQRPVKFVKYLSRLGWDITVLTVANPSVPVLDESLMKDVPSNVTLLKARTFEPSYGMKQSSTSPNTTNSNVSFVSTIRGMAIKCMQSIAKVMLQPDAQILWYPKAYRMAVEHLKKVEHDIIFATAPPYTNFILGKNLKKKFQIPFVADFRDEWDISSQYLENSSRHYLSDFLRARMQKAVFAQLDVIVATTQSSTDAIVAAGGKLGSTRQGHCIYNGFDVDDFAEVLVEAKLESFRDKKSPIRIVYTGTLWNLTTVKPLVLAVELMLEGDASLKGRFEFVFLGRKTPDQKSLLLRLAATGCQVFQEDYLPHSDALKWMKSADVLCLLLSEVVGAERVVPGKLFEYLMFEKNILSILPEGETAGIVKEFCPESTFKGSDVEGVANWLKEQAVSDELPSLLKNASLNFYNREVLTNKLDKIFLTLIKD